MKGDVREDGHEREENAEADRERGHELRIAEVSSERPLANRLAWRGPPVMRQPAGDDDGEDEVAGPDEDEADAPARFDAGDEPMGRWIPGQNAAEESTQHRTADVDGHHAGYARRGPLLRDVGDRDAED